MKFFPTQACASLILFGLQSCGSGPIDPARLPFPEQTAGLNQEVLARFQEAHAALQKQPASHAAWMHLGMTYEAHSYIKLALECYRAAAELKDDARTHYRMSIALAGAGDLPQAVSAIERSIAAQADYAPSHLQLGAYLFDQGRFDEAFAAYGRGRELNPEHLGGALGMARVELQRGAPLLAIALLEENLAKNPNEPNTRRLLHTAYLHAGQGKQAAELVVKWHAFRSPGPDPWAQEFAAYALPPVMELARAAMDRNDGAQAIDLLEPFVAANPEETNGLAHLAWAYHMDGKTAQALDLLETSMEQFPTDLLLMGIKVRVLESQGRPKVALDLNMRMLSIDPDHLDALEVRARLFLKLKKPGQAIKAYQQLLQLDRSRMELWQGLGEAQLKAELWQAASDSFREALSLRPGAEAPFVGAMHAKWMLGDPQEAQWRLVKRKNLGPEGRLLLQQINAVMDQINEE